MAESQGEARPNRELTRQGNANQKEHGGVHKDETANNPFFALVEQKGLFKKGFTPSGDDPAYYPVVLLNELNYFIVNREDIKNNPGGGKYAAIGEHWAPMKDTLRKIKTAYEIIAYPFCRQEGRRFAIESELALDQQSFDRRSVELNEEELGMLNKLAAARGLPCDSEKRVYEYSEVLGNSSPSAKLLEPQK